MSNTPRNSHSKPHQNTNRMMSDREVAQLLANQGKLSDAQLEEIKAKLTSDIRSLWKNKRRKLPRSLGALVYW